MQQKPILIISRRQYFSLQTKNIFNLYKLYHFILFSGKRKCLGESVARTTVFLFLVNMVKEFKFTPVSGSELPDCEPVGGLTLMPKDFEVQIEPITN